MKFEIDFNDMAYRNNKLLEEVGAKLEDLGEYSAYFIELNSFEELEIVLDKVNKETKDYYNALVTYDSPMIFLDNKA